MLESEGIPYWVIENIGNYRTDRNPHIIISGQKTKYQKGVLSNLIKLSASGDVVILPSIIFNTVSQRSFSDIKIEHTKFSIGDFSVILDSEKTAERVPVLIGKIGKGLMIGCFSNLESYWSNSQKVTKRICLDITSGKFTTENMCRIVKGNMRKYIRSILLQACRFIDSPLMYLWKFPDDYKNVCNLRIDVDPDKNLNEKEALSLIHNTFKYAKGQEDRTTFFINFYRRHPNYCFFVPYLKDGFDIQSHNFIHCLFPDYKTNLKNFALAHQLLKTNSVTAKGFSCPEYFWYDHTADILEQFKYEYSHSFGFDYNNYPYRPVINGKVRSYMELPNDPLVWSKLTTKNKKADPNKVAQVYIETLKDKLESVDIGCIKYEHPRILGKYPEISKAIFRFFDEQKDMIPTTLSNWSDWLHQRIDLLGKIDLIYTRNDRGDAVSIVVDPNFHNKLDSYGIGVQYDDDSIHVHKLANKPRQQILVKNAKSYKKKPPENMQGEIVFNSKEKKISWFHSRKHRHKLIKNYLLFHSFCKPLCVNESETLTS